MAYKKVEYDIRLWSKCFDFTVIRFLKFLIYNVIDL